MKRHQVYQSRSIPVPQRLYENHKRLIKVRKELTQKLNRPPTKEELSDAVGMSIVQIDRCVTAMAQKCFSLDQTLHNRAKATNDNSESTFYDLVESNTDESNGAKPEQMFLREDLMKFLDRHLSEVEMNLLLLRYGFSDQSPPHTKNGSLTIAEISRIVDLKPDKVRRMINKSLMQLKAVMGSEWIEYERDLL